MSLEVLHNRADHTHENEQFRRFVSSLNSIFEQKKWNGLLIGNPFNESYSRFRADAILLYNHGLIIIDFKDYRGTIKLPPNDNEFEMTKWYTESEKDKSRLEIKAGASFINPYRQLKYYRAAFFEIVEKNIFLNGSLNPSRTCAANAFSGPVEIINEIPKTKPYYKIFQESNIATFLYDFASENSYSIEIANALKSIFPAEKWEEQSDFSIPALKNNSFLEIEKEVETELSNFLKEDSSGIFVLESMNVDLRDSWMKYLLTESSEYGIPQVEVWAHSSRISKKIAYRTNIEAQSLYSVIYGGSTKIEGDEEDDTTTQIESEEDNLLEIIPIKSNEHIDNNAVIILHEAHLINRSLNQSELLRFGTGRLLEDVLTFLKLEKSSRKIICIGDPYSITFGRFEDSSLDLNNLSELFKGTIKHFRQSILEKATEGKTALSVELAKSIEGKIFNQLQYFWHPTSLIEITREQVEVKLKHWYSEPKISEPHEAILFYSKKDAKKTNLWIKKNCLKTSTELSKGDLLIINNNVIIPDDSGFNQPKRITNGMFFTVSDITITESYPIQIKQSNTPVILSFSKIRVKCISLNGLPEAELWMLDNYFTSDDELSREEKIAFKVFVSIRLIEEKKAKPFTNSEEFKHLMQDLAFVTLTNDEKRAIEVLSLNYQLPKEKKQKIKTTQIARTTLSRFYNKYNKRLFSNLRETDPYINAVFVNYGWALTVHKTLGSSYSETIVNGYQGESRGINNSDYFRWLYSALSATSSVVSIINPQIIHPLMNCVFEDSTDSNDNIVLNSKKYLSYPGYLVRNNFKEKILEIENINVKGAICEISQMLEQHGYILESTRKHSDYLTKAHFSIPQSIDKKLILNIDNKGEKDNCLVSNIRIEKLENTDNTLINQCIEQLFNSKADLNIEESISIPEDFRKGIYLKWIEKFESHNYRLGLFESHNNQDLFFAANGDDRAIFRVWYGTSEKEKTKGFINKIIVMEKTGNDIGNKLKNWLL